jgi:hypothetical protein
MAYSDYGGKAYRNGVWIEDRSDCVILPTEELFSTPGMWPGFATLTVGTTWKQAADLTNLPTGHAILGDGPIYLVLYKQSTVKLYRGFEEIDIVSLIDKETAHLCTFEGEVFIFTDMYALREEPIIVSLDGHEITIWWTHEDNFYVYAQVKQPDGTCWQGWSGYRVGVGFNEDEEKYSSAARDEKMKTLFSEKGN